MAKVGSAPGTKLAGRADNAAGGSAGIEIVGFPQMLYTRTFGDPDTHENAYTVDLNVETLHMRTRLYAVVSGRTSFFKVEIAGKISGGTFVVRNPIHGTVIMQVEEERFRQASFFSTTLAQECLRAQVEQERFGIIEESAGAETYNEMRLMMMMEGSKVPIALRQKEQDGGWEIVDGKRNEVVGKLTAQTEENLKKVISSVQDLFAKK